MGSKLFVGNLSYNTTEADLRAAFAAESQVSIDRAAKEMIELYLQTMRS